jgi:hypothetical protein
VATIPELAEQWHPTRNGDLRPEHVVAGTAKKLWWKCPVDDHHEWQTNGYHRTNGQGCPFCAARGYNPAKPGALYVLCGDKWGKVGISNVLTSRLATHAAGGSFGSVIMAIQFEDGSIPIVIERELLSFIKARTKERAPRVGGYTESFPARLRDEVLGELKRSLGELSKPAWSIIPELSVSSAKWR